MNILHPTLYLSISLKRTKPMTNKDNDFHFKGLLCEGYMGYLYVSNTAWDVNKA